VKHTAFIIPVAVGALFFLTFSAPTLGEDEDFYAQLSVGEPAVHGNLAVYPVYLAGGGEKMGDVLTMAEAAETGKFKIAEIEEGAEVNTLEVHNDTDKYVVVLAGEMVRGAKQDRIISYDTVIPPGGKFDVDAFCVEAGRWNEVSTHFAYEKEMAPSSVRATAQGNRDQGEVWAEVSKVNAARGAMTETDTLTASYDSEEFQADVKRYEKALKDLAKNKDVVGVVVVAEGEVRAGDVFANHDLFAAVWPQLLTSYAMDAALAGELGEVPSASEISAYLAQLEEAEREMTFEDDEGMQNRSTLSAGEMNAYELEYKGKKLHLNMQ
jgi:hypothetical protein